jgi:hypothetical protein
MVMASLAWSPKAWSALMLPVSPRHADKHEAERRTWLRMEFATFCAAVIQMPCQIVKTGKRLIYRLGLVIFEFSGAGERVFRLP